KKFLRRNQAGLAVAAGLLLAVAAMAAAGWALRDRSARQSRTEQAEIDRQTAVQRQVRDSLAVAHALIAENKLAPARETLAQARAQLNRDSSALGSLANEVEVAQAGLDRFQQFLELIDRAYQAETAPPEEPRDADALGGAGLLANPELPASRLVSRRPAAAVPFLLEAL